MIPAGTRSCKIFSPMFPLCCNLLPLVARSCRQVDVLPYVQQCACAAGWFPELRLGTITALQLTRTCSRGGCLAISLVLCGVSMAEVARKTFTLNLETRRKRWLDYH